MTEQQFETVFDAITTALWEATTGNGRDIDAYMWDTHYKNCQSAVNNSYSDGMSVDEWHEAAIACYSRYGCKV
jgi:crotonobetainyl-CoA:carnitine CoA-transferase CaiB-like acyl-CoA transferase